MCIPEWVFVVGFSVCVAGLLIFWIVYPDSEVAKIRRNLAEDRERERLGKLLFHPPSRYSFAELEREFYQLKAKVEAGTPKSRRKRARTTPAQPS